MHEYVPKPREVEHVSVCQCVCMHVYAWMRCDLIGRAQVEHASVYDFRSAAPLDAAYFSGSLMIMPDPAAALRHVAAQLRPGGVIYCTQTFQLRRDRLAELTKPLLKFVTTIDFGRVTYEADFLAAVQRAQLVVADNAAIGSNWSSARSFRLIVLKRAGDS